jgi:hypothetical protein
MTPSEINAFLVLVKVTKRRLGRDFDLAIQSKRKVAA